MERKKSNLEKEIDKKFRRVGPAIFFFTILAIISMYLTSCSSGSQARKSHLETLQTEGLDRLMVEECGSFLIDYDKHIAIDTTLENNRFNRFKRVYKLNSDSTRYVLCK